VVKTTAGLPYPSLAPTEIFASMLALLRRGEHIRGAHCLVIGLGPAAGSSRLVIHLGAARITALEKVASRRAQGILSGADNAFDRRSRGLEALSAAPPIGGGMLGQPGGSGARIWTGCHEVLLFGYNDRPLEINPSDGSQEPLDQDAGGFRPADLEETVGYLNRSS